jgi:hypothetical protein
VYVYKHTVFAVMGSRNILLCRLDYLLLFSFIRCYSRFKVREEQLKGQYTSVCLSVAFIATIGPKVPLLRKNGIQAFQLLCSTVEKNTIQVFRFLRNSDLKPYSGKNGIRCKHSSQLDVKWRTPVKYEGTPSSTPFHSRFIMFYMIILIQFYCSLAFWWKEL